VDNHFSIIKFIHILYKYKKILLLQVIILSILSITFALITPLSYTATVSILPPSQGGILGSFLSPTLTKGLTGALGGSAFDQDGETNKLLAILNSRKMNEKIIYQFNLMEEFESPTIEDALETIREKISFDINDEGLITISVTEKTKYFHLEEDENKVREFVKNVADFIVEELDYTYTALGTQKAKYERLEIEKRYEKNKSDIEQLELQIKDFSKETGVLLFKEQTEALILALAELENQKIVQEIKLSVLENSFDESSSINETRYLINELNSKINSLKLNGSSMDSMSVLPSYQKAPEYGLEYARLQREFTVQGLIYEFLTQQYEQVRLQETKETPSLQFIDLPQLPTKRSAPTRSLIVIAIMFLGTLLTIFYLLIYYLYSSKMKELVHQITDLN
tara:strand:+ start:49144 stop:50328 length:1185 start_codon:yes stop_codon:yes gene_type:complete